MVAIRPSSSTFESSERPNIIISVLNKTNESFNFSTENISATTNGKDLKIYTYEELAEEVKDAEMWAAIAAALNGAAKSMNASNAGYTHHSGTYNSTTYGTGYNAYGSGSYSGYSYDAAAVQQAQATANAETQAEMQAIKNKTENALNILNSTILRKTTVMPNTWHGGYISLDKLANTKQPQNIRIVVTINNDSHIFVIKQTEIIKQ